MIDLRALLDYDRSLPASRAKYSYPRFKKKIWGGGGGGGGGGGVIQDPISANNAYPRLGMPQIQIFHAG